MAAGNSRDLCSKCLERFDRDVRPPVALSCGHSFCRPCLISLFSSCSCLKCPQCSRIHEGKHPQDIPINYLLLDVVARVTDNGKEASSCKDKEEIDLKKYQYCKVSDSSDSDSEEEDSKDKKKNSSKYSSRMKETSNVRISIEGDGNCRENISKRTESEHHPDVSALIGEDKDKLVSSSKIKKIINQRNVMILLVVVLGATLMGLASCYWIAPAILKGWGFTEKGVKRGSYAAHLMREAQEDGTIPNDSWVSWYQRAGMKGFDTPAKVFLFFTGFVLFCFIAFIICNIWRLCKIFKETYKKYKELAKE